MAFWSTEGQASFHTAWAMGPSTIERSKRRAGTAALGIADEPGGGSAADGAVTVRSADKNEDHTSARDDSRSVRRSSHALERTTHVGMREHDGRLPLERFVIAPGEAVATLRCRQQALDLIQQIRAI